MTNSPAQDPPGRPSQVTLAAGLLSASLGIGVVVSALTWTQLTATASIGFALTVQVATIGLLFWLIYELWSGRNWARLTVAVLWGVGLPFYFSTLMRYFTISRAAGYLSLLQTALHLAAFYLIFFRPGSSWFKARAVVP